MKKNIRLKNLLIIIYFIMLVVAICLSINQSFDGKIISLVFFVISFVIFLNAYICLNKSYLIAKQLRKAKNTIISDFETDKTMLWSKYSSLDSSYLFKNGSELQAAYASYMNEMERLSVLSDGDCKCDIDTYIDEELIDICASKNMLNIVPGVMTGLGILGTFVGLTLGLQNFNTGNAEEISNSIRPLMNGIKVAFHTSIYGMLFSLFFNWIYKNEFEDTYKALEDFLSAFNTYVAGDSFNENTSASQNLLKKLPDIVGDKVSESIANVLTPAVNEMTSIMQEFSKNVTQNQLEGMNTIVESFINQMNQALGGNFEELSNVISETCKLQRDNNEFIQTVLARIESVSNNILDIDKMSSKIIEELSGYIQEVENLQSEINKGFMNISVQIDEQKQYNEAFNGYIKQLVDYENSIRETSKIFMLDMKSQIELLSKTEEEMTKNTRENLDMLANNAKNYLSQMSEAVNMQMKEIYRLENDITEFGKNSLDELAQNAEQYNKELANACQKQIDQIVTLSSTVTGDMDKATQELGKVSRELNNQLSDSLKTTFSIFDTNLADISQHLAGTIQQIDVTIESINKTTDRVPQTVSAAYDSLRHSFDDMQKNVDELVYSMDVMQRNVNKITDKFDNEWN